MISYDKYLSTSCIALGHIIVFLLLLNNQSVLDFIIFKAFFMLL